MLDVRELATNKEYLRSLADKDYKIPNDIDYLAFAKALLANFSSTDGELRDDLSYMIVARGIIDRELLTAKQLEEVLFTALDNDHLFYHIGEAGKDSVFMRSFSNLIIAAILYTDAKSSVLSKGSIQRTKDELLRYAREENDWRGHVTGKGWAYAMAHLADALDVCAQNPALSRDDREEVMRVLCDLASISVPLYHEEDMRLAAVAYHIIACKQVSDDFLSVWLEDCFIARKQDVRSWMRLTNMKNFLRSLYFRLLWGNMAIAFAEQISNLLHRADVLYLEVTEGL